MPTSPTPPDLLEPLNAAQRRAATHGLQGPGKPPPLLVIAGAGSGKTLVLATRVTQLVLAGVDPQRILLVTFSRRAAAAMERRVSRLLHEAMRLPGSSAPPRLAWCGTFHSVAARLLRLHARQLTLPQDFTVLDHADSEELMGLARQQLGLHASEQRFPMAASCLAMHSRVLNSAEPLRELVEREYPWCDQHVDALKAVFTAYTEMKLAQHLLDFDDLLLYWQAMMDEPALAVTVRARFEHVLVDEYQDTNPLQQHIVHGLCPDGRGLVVVGDDAQAIYSFSWCQRARHARLPGAVHAAGRADHAGAELPLDAADPGCGQRRHRAGQRRLRQTTLQPRCGRCQAATRERAGRSRRGCLGR